MKSSFWVFVICCVTVLASCKNEDSPVGPDGMVRTVDSVAMDPQIGVIPLDDGSFVIISNGMMVKLDGRGRMMWRKPISTLSGIYAAVADPGSGFILFGFPVNPPTQSSFYACRIDVDGNVLNTIQVNLNFPNAYIDFPVSMIRLANGGYALAIPSGFTWSSYLKILDHDFNLLYSRVIFPPAGYHSFMVNNICELPGGHIAMIARVDNLANNYAWINAAYLLARPDGSVKSLVTLGDSVVNKMAYVSSPCAGGFFAVSSTKIGFLSRIGSFVNYYSGVQIAGTIKIDRFDSEGKFIGSRTLTGYSGYGVIKTIRKTSDGGFLLCGTVDNNGSSISVSMTKVFVCKLDAGLNEVWSKSFESTYQAIGTAAVPTADGGCLITGNLKSFDNFYQMLIIRTDANGTY